MDPKATINRILELLESGDDYHAILESVEDLVSWLNNGGYFPENIDPNAYWYDIVIGVYWHCVDNYNGQTDPRYAIQCTLGRYYDPGPICCGPDTSGSVGVYDRLFDIDNPDANDWQAYIEEQQEGF